MCFSCACEAAAPVQLGGGFLEPPVPPTEGDEPGKAQTPHEGEAQLDLVYFL